MQYTYDVHWGAPVQPLLQWKTHKHEHIVCVLGGRGAFCIQREMRMRHIVICSLSSSTILFHYLINGTIFGGGGGGGLNNK